MCHGLYPSDIIKNYCKYFCWFLLHSVSSFVTVSECAIVGTVWTGLSFTLIIPRLLTLQPPYKKSTRINEKIIPFLMIPMWLYISNLLNSAKITHTFHFLIEMAASSCQPAGCVEESSQEASYSHSALGSSREH